jgi:hypothetical protein
VFCIFTSKWAFVFFMFYTNDTMPLPLWGSCNVLPEAKM